ncbi:hypothetical protein BH18THE2_BH18THE2_15130 [soil metagenome]
MLIHTFVNTTMYEDKYQMLGKLVFYSTTFDTSITALTKKALLFLLHNVHIYNV